MSFTYDSAMPADQDTVRFLIQDTNSARQLFQDEEINWVLTQEANIYMAAARLCDTVVVRARDVKRKKIGDLDITYDAGRYLTMSAQLRARGMTYQVPFAGGISNVDKQVLQNDPDAAPPAFVRRLDDNPAAPSPSIPSTNPLTTI